MIDIHNDKDMAMLIDISKEECLPDFVKQADISSMVDTSELPGEAFALSSKKLYPIYDKANTWLSSRYFIKSGDAIPEPTRSMVREKIKQACDLFGIDLPQVKHKKEGVKLAESDYAMAEKYNDKKVLRYPVNTKANTEKSIVKFAQEYTLYPLEWRIKTAHELNKKASEYDIHIDKNHPVSRYTCNEKSPETIKIAIMARSRYTLSDEISSLYKEIITKIGSETAETLVNAIDILDKSSGLNRYWDHGIPDPYLSVFKYTEKVPDAPGIKVANIDIHQENINNDNEIDKEKIAYGTIMLADQNIPVDTLAQMPIEWYSDLLGEDVAKEIADGDEIDVEKLKMILSSLPRPSQLLIVHNLPG